MEKQESLSGQVGYLKGLLEGMDLPGMGAQGKLTEAVVALLGDLADRVESVEEMVDDLDDYVESIDDDLSKLEANGAPDLSDMNDDADEFADDIGSTEDQLHLLGGRGEKPEEETLSGCLCPACAAVFFVGAEEDGDAEYVCPCCGKTVRPIPLTAENAPIARPARQ